MASERFKWEGEDLNNLINKSIDELMLIYPDKKVSTLERIKRHYTQKIREAVPSNTGELTEFEKLLKRSNIRPDQIQKVKRMNLWQSAKKNDDTGDWDVQDLYGMEVIPVNESAHFEPVEPAKITPTKKRPSRENVKWILVYGDGQVDYRRIIDPVTDKMELLPLHNLAAHEIIKQINADYQPETTVNLGDFADMAALSRFDPDSDHFHKTLGPSMRYIHDFYAQMKSDNPEARHVEVDSNHAIRVKKQVLNNLPALYDFVRPGDDSPYPMMTYYYLANLGKIGIEFVSGYGSAEFVYGQESGNPIVFKHGTHSSSSAGATVKKESVQNPSVNVVRGHGHSHEEVRYTTREGRQLFYVQLGSTCLNNGVVPGYSSSIDDFNKPVHTHLNHQTTIAMIEDYGNGRYNLNPIEIKDGVAYFNGKKYNGNE